MISCWCWGFISACCCTALQSQKAVTAYFTSKQVLPYGFVYDSVSLPACLPGGWCDCQNSLHPRLSRGTCLWWHVRWIINTQQLADTRKCALTGHVKDVRSAWYTAAHLANNNHTWILTQHPQHSTSKVNNMALDCFKSMFFPLSGLLLFSFLAVLLLFLHTTLAVHPEHLYTLIRFHINNRTFITEDFLKIYTWNTSFI